MWDKTIHKFNESIEGTTLQTDFTYLGDKQIRSVEPFCQCTTTKVIGNMVTVLWKLKVRKIERDASTYVTIVFQDDSIQDLELEAHVITNGS